MKTNFKKDLIYRIVSILFLLIGTVIISYFANVPVSTPTSTNFEKTTMLTTEEMSPESTTDFDAENTLVLIHPQETDVTVYESSFLISGMCDLQYPLTINSIPVTVSEDGTFSYECVLEPGNNQFVVSNSIKTIELSVRYDFQVIKTVSPSKNVSVEGGTKLELKAEALKGATVSASLNNTTVALHPVAIVKNDLADEGVHFIEYSGMIDIPEGSAKKMKLGRIQFSGTYQEYTQKKNGATVYVNAKEVKIPVASGQGFVKAPTVRGDGLVEVCTPQTNCGLGTTKMCTVNVPYSETAPNRINDDKSVPLCTPLIKGTVDYITGEAQYDDKQYYLLNSGVKILQKDCTPVEGYILSPNTISTYKSYTENNTNLILTMNWKVPFQSEVKSQPYYTGYRGRAYNVKQFTASYIDFVFSYTNAAAGNFDFSGSNVVKKAEWINIGENGTTTLRVYFKVPGVFYGYSAYYSSDNRLVISFNNKPTTLNKSVVMIDPGHGGKDSGAIGVNGTYESHLNFIVANMVREKLEENGVKVMMSRTSDVFYTLDERQQMARDGGIDVFASIHHNSNPHSYFCGPEVYYYRANSKNLASAIHENLVSTWKNIYANDSDLQAKMDNDGVRFYPFRVTRIEECPAVLVECGYLSNTKECSEVCLPYNQRQIADAIANGIMSFLKNS